MQGQNHRAWQRPPERLALATGDGLLGGDGSWQLVRDIFSFFFLKLRLLIFLCELLSAAPEIKTLIPLATSVVISQAAQLYQPTIVSQPILQVALKSMYWIVIQNSYGKCIANCDSYSQSHQLVGPGDAVQQTDGISSASPGTPAASSVAPAASAAPPANTAGEVT